MSRATPTSAADVTDVTDPADLGVLAAAAELRARRLSAVELADAVLARIADRNGGEPTYDGAPDAVNAWARVYPDEARAAARAADLRRAREGDATPVLCGVPVGLKDLYAVAGLPLTASSRVLQGNVATEDCVVWQRLRAAGMVLVGHTHTHEFAFGGTTDQVGNPWDLSRPGWSRRRWGRTRPDRSASRRRWPASARSSRPTAGSPSTGSSRWRRRSTTPGRWPARSPTAARCSRPWRPAGPRRRR
jgi:Asp-tRNA(Asn)/Glu-tRNA(Gln) amidotransferase A subunit family amidase